MKSNKYHAQRTFVGGMKFDSKKEAERYFDLSLMQKAGVISGLQRQVKYLLIPTQRDRKGKVLFRPRYYVADFVYRRNGQLVVEDVKGVRTEVYKLKRALMFEKYGILVEEV